MIALQVRKYVMTVESATAHSGLSVPIFVAVDRDGEARVREEILWKLGGADGPGAVSVTISYALHLCLSHFGWSLRLIKLPTRRRREVRS